MDELINMSDITNLFLLLLTYEYYLWASVYSKNDEFFYSVFFVH